MLNWLFGKLGKTKRVSEIKSSDQIKQETKLAIKQIEMEQPISFKFTYVTTVRCGLGFDYKTYEIAIDMDEVSSERLTTKCDICGKTIHLYTTREVMSDGIIYRMAVDSLMNSRGLSDIKGHSLSANVKVLVEDKERYDKDIAPTVFKRDYDVLFNVQKPKIL